MEYFGDLEREHLAEFAFVRTQKEAEWQQEYEESLKEKKEVFIVVKGEKEEIKHLNN